MISIILVALVCAALGWTRSSVWWAVLIAVAASCAVIAMSWYWLETIGVMLILWILLLRLFVPLAAYAGARQIRNLVDARS